MGERCIGGVRFSAEQSNTLLDIIKARRDVRGNLFTDEPISDSELDSIIEAGLYAPSVGYSQPWKFVIIKDTHTKERVYTNFKKSFKKSKKRFKHRPEYGNMKLEALRESKLHIAVFYHHQGGYILGQTSQGATGAYSVAAAIQNMWLMARSLNIGIGWVSIIKPKKIRKIVGLGEAYTLVGYLCVGRVSKFLDEPELKTLGWERLKSKKQSIITIDEQNQRGSTDSISTIIGDRSLLDTLVDKRATMMISLSHTKTALIEGITQAGVAGHIDLTPTLDAEFLSRGRVKSLKKIAKTPKGVPTPALITRAVHLLTPYRDIEFLDLGVTTKPKIKDAKLHHLQITPSGDISKGAGIDAKRLFEKGVMMGRGYTPKGEYLILGESVPSGTTTATATALALGYDAGGLFSSSFADVPDSIRQQTIQKALDRVEGMSDIFDILGEVSDNMLIFNAGFVLGIDGRFPIVLAGGTQMACLLLVINSIARYMGAEVDSSRLMLWTTKWVAEDSHSDIRALLEMLDFPISAHYGEFDFAQATQPKVKLYDKGEAKEGVAAGAAIIYAYLHGVSKEDISRQVEGFVR